MFKYKIVFCDIDGTLLNSSHQITENTKKIVKEIANKGVIFVLVSARMPDGIFPLQEELKIKAPIVCYSGALILDQDGNAVKSIGISRNKVSEIKDYINNKWKRASCSIYSYNNWIVDDNSDPWVLQEYEITKVKPKVGPLPIDQDIHKILCMGKVEQIQELEDELTEKYSELTIYRSKDTYLEIMDGSVLKSNAVEFLTKINGVVIEDTVSIGDNYNDVDMLLTTGIGVAMGNAPEKVKAEADCITLDNDHEGLFEILQRLYS